MYFVVSFIRGFTGSQIKLVHNVSLLFGLRFQVQSNSSKKDFEEVDHVPESFVSMITSDVRILWNISYDIWNVTYDM